MLSSPGQLDLSVEDGRLYLGGNWRQFIPAEPTQGIKEIETFRYILCAVYAVIGWEYIVTFHEERRRWKQLIVQRKIVLVNIFVIIGRYMMIANAITSAIYFFGNPGDCQSPMTLIFLTYFLVWLSSALIFVQRVRALYHSNPAVNYFIMGVTAFCSCLWIVALGFFYSSRLPPEAQIPRMPTCVLAPSPPWRAIGFGGCIIFDLAVLGLTVLRVRQQVQKEKRSPMTGSAARRHGVKSARSWLIETALVYGGVCLTINVATFFVIIFERDMILEAYPIPFAVVINTIVASRIVFHSDLWGAKTALLESRTLQGFVHPNHHRDGVLLSRNQRSRGGNGADGIGKGAATTSIGGGNLAGDFDDGEMDKRSLHSSMQHGTPLSLQGAFSLDPNLTSGISSGNGSVSLSAEKSGFAFSKGFSDFALNNGNRNSMQSFNGGQTPVLRAHAPNSSSAANSPFAKQVASMSSSPYINDSPTPTTDDVVDDDEEHHVGDASDEIEDLEMQVRSESRASPMQMHQPTLHKQSSFIGRARSPQASSSMSDLHQGQASSPVGKQADGRVRAGSGNVEQEIVMSPEVVRIQREVSRRVD